MTAVGRAVRGERASSTQEAILVAAERLFAEHGVFAVSNRQVSEAAGRATTPRWGITSAPRPIWFALSSRSIAYRSSGFASKWWQRPPPRGGRDDAGLGGVFGLPAHRTPCGPG
ncbi:bacterial regulatory s, tetR family protein [Mycobacterium ulcerans str. Harvey]|uniref:Bacterial regulatory s, tetR family protein n=1 Tax=Mycobacterium ulcerans str. Harvey TaxID=1299332 RepID=A0ABP3APE8_MYCUL|nr:bacterial regulatory s, tetR family protein [Mycobacterium ulcerans str. Harvey]